MNKGTVMCSGKSKVPFTKRLTRGEQTKRPRPHHNVQDDVACLGLHHLDLVCGAGGGRRATATFFLRGQGFNEKPQTTVNNAAHTLFMSRNCNDIMQL